MNNTIKLYNVPYLYGSVTQPYFMSDDSRNSYFEGLQALTVNNGTTNIKIGVNFEIVLTVNVDVTNIEKYNFAIVEYNNKKYYAYIIDSEYVNINMTKLYLQRAVLFEITNYLDKFEHLKISKTTYKYKTYYTQASYFLPNNFNSYEIPKNDFFDDFIRLTIYFFNNVDGTGFFKSNGIISNYTCLIDFNPLITNVLNEVNEPIVASSLSAGDLSKLSPYLISATEITLPLKKVNNKLILPILTSNGRLGILDKNVTFCSEMNLDYFFKLSSSNVLDEYDFYIYGEYNKITLRMRDFSVGYSSTSNYSASIKILYNINCSGCDLIFTAYALMGISKKVIINYTCSIPFMFPFSITSAENFNAENLFYNQISTNFREKMTLNSLGQGLTEVATGLTQIGSGFLQHGSFSSEGAGNIFRSINTFSQIEVNNNAYDKERELLAQQSKMAPAKTEKGNSVISAVLPFGKFDVSTIKNNPIIVIRRAPAETVYARFISDLTVYGINDDREEDSFNFDIHVFEGFFYLSALGVLKHPTSLTTRQYSELYSILKAGCRYEII